MLTGNTELAGSCSLLHWSSRANNTKKDSLSARFERVLALVAAAGIALTAAEMLTWFVLDVWEIWMIRIFLVLFEVSLAIALYLTICQ